MIGMQVHMYRITNWSTRACNSQLSRLRDMNKVCWPQRPDLTWSDGVDEEDAPGGGLVNEVGELVGLLQRVEVSPACPVLVVILGSILLGVHTVTPFAYSAGMVLRHTER